MSDSRTASEPVGATPVYPSLVRPILIGGVERIVMIPFVGFVISLVAFFPLNWVTPSLAVAALAFGLPILRRINKRDGQAWVVVAEHVRVGGFYPGQGSSHARRTSLRR